MSAITAQREAATLAGDLPGLLLEARRLAASAPGVHGRRSAGPGEAFWQYRDHRSEDGARLVDWRRSARGDRLYVREREREAAQSAFFWIDPDPGMAWRGGVDRPDKRYRALTVALALAMLMTRAGERVGALGARTHGGQQGPSRLALDLARCASEPPLPAPRSRVLVVSDCYAPIATWAARLGRISQTGASGALLCIADPAEENLPFRGRTLFVEPGAARREALVGRAEDAQQIYFARLEAHRTELRALAARAGFPMALHRTDHSAAPTLSLLSNLLGERSP